MQTGSRSLFLGLALAFAFTALAPLARADSITYAYTGNPFTTLNDFSCTLPGLCGVEGSFTLSSPLAPNLDETEVTPLSYSFTNGKTTLNNANSTISEFKFTTDSSGVIDGWAISISIGGATSFIGSEDSGIGVGDEGTSDDGQSIAYNNNDPGTWTVAPEPASWALLGTGALLLLGLGMISERRRLKAA